MGTAESNGRRTPHGTANCTAGVNFTFNFELSEVFLGWEFRALAPTIVRFPNCTLRGLESGNSALGVWLSGRRSWWSRRRYGSIP
eukprot:jgi/Botrbrau1/11272/Bobra.0038s0040.4